MAKDPSTVPGWRTVPQATGRIQRGKKEKMEVSVKVRYKKPSLQIIFELLFLQGLGIVSIK